MFQLALKSNPSPQVGELFATLEVPAKLQRSLPSFRL
jgi:hypothetical protein